MTTLIITRGKSSHHPAVLKDRQFFYYEDENNNIMSQWMSHYVACALFLDVLEECTQPDMKDIHSSSEVLPKSSPLRKIRNKVKRRNKVCISSTSHKHYTTHLRRNKKSEVAPPNRPPVAQTHQRRAEMNPMNMHVARKREVVRSSNKKSQAALVQEAEHFFHKARLLSYSYPRAKRHYMICKSICGQLKWMGDVSVCYWYLGQIAFEKCYYAKAMMFYGKSIKTFDFTKIFNQPSFSDILNQYHSANLKKRAQPENIADVRRDEISNTDYHSDVVWQKAVASVDVPQPQTEQLVLSNSKQEYEDAVEEQGHLEDYFIPYEHMYPYEYPMTQTTSEEVEELPAIIQHFHGILGVGDH